MEKGVCGLWVFRVGWGDKQARTGCVYAAKVSEERCAVQTRRHTLGQRPRTVGRGSAC